MVASALFLAAAATTLAGCSSGYSLAKATPSAIDDYRLLTPAKAWPVVLASNSLGDPSQYSSGDDDLLDAEVDTLASGAWSTKSAQACTAYVEEPQIKYDGASHVHAADATSFSTFDMYFAITKTGFVEGGLQLDSQTSSAKAAGEKLMKDALAAAVD